MAGLKFPSKVLKRFAEAGVLDETLDAALAQAPHADIANEVWAQGVSVAEALALTGLVAGKGAGRRTISEGGASVNNIRVSDENAMLSDADLLAGNWIVVRRGRRHIGGLRITNS